MQGAGFWGWALGYVPARRLEPGASEGHTPAREPPRQACVLNLASTNNLSSQPLSDPSHSRLPFLLGGSPMVLMRWTPVHLFLQSPLKGRPRCVSTLCASPALRSHPSVQEGVKVLRRGCLCNESCLVLCSPHL